MKSLYFSISLLLTSLIFSYTNLAHANNKHALDKQINEIVKKHKIPSIAYAIIEPGKPQYIKVIGNANQKQALQATTSTQYRIGSVSKLFVGIAALQLIEQNKLSFDDTLKTLLPDLEYHNPWADSHPIKLIHLLENTAGWREISLSEFAYSNNPPMSLEQVLAVNPDSRTSRWPAGTRHAYTNTASTVVALIIEKVTGVAFESYVEEHILKPLAMENTTYEGFESEALATGYRKHKPVAYKHILMKPAGAISSTITDMAKLLTLFIKKDSTILSHDMLSRMGFSHSTNVGKFDAGYGITNSARFYKGVKYRGHDGSLPGWMTEFVYSPKFNAGFVLLQNSDNARAIREIGFAISKSLEKYTNTNAQTPSPIPAALMDQSGYYQYINPRFQNRYFLERLSAFNTLHITHDGATFKQVFPPGWQRSLTLNSQSNWQNSHGNIVMKQGIDPIEGLVFHYGDRVFKPVSALNAWADKLILFIWLILLLGMCFYSIIWPIQVKRKKLTNQFAISLRKNVSSAALSSLLFLVLIGLGLAEPIARLGTLSIFSIGILISSLMMLLTSALTLRCLYLIKSKLTHKTFFIFSLIFISLQSIIVIYLAWHGAIGLRTWA